ncbi:hypothetical protein, partial [Bradyrhizobium canariense]|uniref:hypothetical protein n=1 Tax=Bradyrhizobium canariense TaxID=255045 RepID=UPI001A7E11C3
PPRPSSLLFSLSLFLFLPLPSLSSFFPSPSSSPSSFPPFSSPPLLLPLSSFSLSSLPLLLFSSLSLLPLSSPPLPSSLSSSFFFFKKPPYKASKFIRTSFIDKRLTAVNGDVAEQAGIVIPGSVSFRNMILQEGFSDRTLTQYP